MKLHNLFLIIFCFCFNQSFSCDCKTLERETMVNKGIEMSNIVFYGELIKLDTINKTYSFKIIELFKGNLISKTIEGVTEGGNCSLFPDKKGLWIVYGNFNNENKMSLSMCSPTQSQGFGPSWPPPPPEIKRDTLGKIIESTEIDLKIHELEFKNESLISFIYQLEKLRAYKLSQNKIAVRKKSTVKDKIIFISLIINMLLISILIFILVKKNISIK